MTATVDVGTEAPSRTFGPITLTDIVRYQGASGDMNPFHHDHDRAREAGFPGAFAVGMLQAGLLATFATDWLGHDKIRRFAVRFKEQVWPGDELTCMGTITEITDRAGERVATVALRCTRQTGGIAIEATAEFVVA